VIDSPEDASGKRELAGAETTPEERERAQKRRQAIRMADLSTVGMVFPIALLLGYFAGKFVGGFFGAPETGGWIGGAFGLVAGFYNVYKTALVLQQQDDEEMRRGQ
jgi:F0F1-type ATP synthase assembly protein I